MGKDAQSMILALQNWSARDSRILRITLWCQSQCQTKPNLFRDALWVVTINVDHILVTEPN